MLSRSRIFALVAVVVLAIAGCGDDSSEPSDTEPPRIISATATDSSHVTIVFSEPVVRADAILHYNYSIEVGLPVLGASPDAANVTVILTTAGMLAIDYKVSASGIKDAAGNPVAATETAFTGSTAPDNTPPTLLYRYPAPGAPSVSVNTRIEFSFSENVQGFGWNITGAPGDDPVSAQLAGTGGNYVGSVMETLDYDRTYAISIQDATDPAGNPMPDISWTFHTVKKSAPY